MPRQAAAWGCLTARPEPDYDVAMIRASLSLAACLFCVVALLAPASPSRAADADSGEPSVPTLEGLYFDWSLYEMQENGKRVCYLSSGLERSSDEVPRRRPAYVLITNRPEEGKRGVVSVNAGFPYDDGSTVLLSIGRKQYHLFVGNGTAWAEDADEPQVIAAIRHGATLVVTGRMKNGPTVTDTFSLRGFPAALTALDESCPVPSAAVEPAVRKHRHKKKT
jgi:invasion protein IalB